MFTVNNNVKSIFTPVTIGTYTCHTLKKSHVT